MVDILLTGVMNMLANAVTALVFFAVFAIIGLVATCWEKLKARGLHRIAAISVPLLLLGGVVTYATRVPSGSEPEIRPADKVEVHADWTVSTWSDEEGGYITAQATIPAGKLWGGCANETTWVQVQSPNGDEMNRWGAEAEDFWRYASLEQGNLKGTRKVAEMVADACGWSLP